MIGLHHQIIQCRLAMAGFRHRIFTLTLGKRTNGNDAILA